MCSVHHLAKNTADIVLAKNIVNFTDSSRFLLVKDTVPKSKLIDLVLQASLGVRGISPWTRVLWRLAKAINLMIEWMRLSFLSFLPRRIRKITDWAKACLCFREVEEKEVPNGDVAPRFFSIPSWEVDSFSYSVMGMGAACSTFKKIIVFSGKYKFIKQIQGRNEKVYIVENKADDRFSMSLEFSKEKKCVLTKKVAGKEVKEDYSDEKIDLILQKQSYVDSGSDAVCRLISNARRLYRALCDKADVVASKLGKNFCRTIENSALCDKEEKQELYTVRFEDELASKLGKDFLMKLEQGLAHRSPRWFMAWGELPFEDKQKALRERR